MKCWFDTILIQSSQKGVRLLSEYPAPITSTNFTKLLDSHNYRFISGISVSLAHSRILLISFTYLSLSSYAFVLWPNIF